MKKKRISIVVISVVVIGILLAVVFIRGAAPEAKPNTVEVIRGDIVKTVLADGNLEMPNKAYLSFGVTGTVEEVLVDEGNNVTKGQVLARLDAPSLELSVEMTELQVRIAREQVRVARAQYERVEEGWESPEGYEFLDDVIASLLGLLGQDEDTARANLRMAELNLRMAELNLESAKLGLEKAVIVAPFAGVIADITISEGEEVGGAALAAPAITLVDTGSMHMRGFIDEIDVAMVEVGQAATITLDALPDKALEGRVDFISPIGTARVGVVSYETTIIVESPVANLKDGMTATAEVIIERRDGVLLVPNRVIRGTRQDPTVKVYIAGQEKEKEIALGLSDGINTEVLSGLGEGDKVIVPAPRERPDDFFMM